MVCLRGSGFLGLAVVFEDGVVEFGQGDHLEYLVGALFQLARFDVEQAVEAEFFHDEGGHAGSDVNGTHEVVVVHFAHAGEGADERPGEGAHRGGRRGRR